jgi:DNA-binding NarL/FixJ family response regulator
MNHRSRLLPPPIRVLVVQAEHETAQRVREWLANGSETTAPFVVNTLATLDMMEEAIRQPPDVVLLDATVPGANSTESVQRLKGLAPDVPIVVFTTSEHDKSAIEWIEDGADEIIPKTALSPLMVAHTLRYAIFRCRIERELVEIREALSDTARALGVTKGE